MITFVSKGCTHAVDEVISSARLRYAHEREDFHAFFPNMTTLEIRHMLRGQQRSETRRGIVLDLFAAQQESPHDLWALLLVQACEAKLVERRLAVSEDEDAQLDQLVFDTFVDALSETPCFLAVEDIQAHVLRTSAQALKKALRREHGRSRLTQERAAREASRARRAFRQAQIHLVRSAG
jgi:hypothetical protein